MTGFGADEYARTRAEDRARAAATRARAAATVRLSGDELREYVDAGYQSMAAQGHGGWRPGKTVSVGFPMLNPMVLLDVLAKAGLGIGPEPTRFPSEPPEGSVLKWVKTFKRNPEQGYTYVALHVNGAWYLTGRTSDPIDFDDLVKLIGDSPCELATNWVEIPQLPSDNTEGLTAEEWFMAAFPQDVVDSDEGREG